MMIPITYRLDDIAEIEYIELALSCMDNAAKISNELEALLAYINKQGCSVANKILNKAKRFRTDYPDSWCLCEWLVMSYEEMAIIRKYLYNVIWSDLKQINATIKKISSKIVEIKSYHDLQSRRNKNYTAHKKIGQEVSKNAKYDTIYNNFKKFNDFYDNWSEKGINYWIVEKTGLKVCPYCNISYTYSRGKMTTAQLDHFFPKSEYPILALCFYNLVPSCPACNKIKHDDTEDMASPYKNGVFRDLRITWDCSRYPSLNKYSEKGSLAALEDMIEIKIETFKKDEQRNLDSMRIQEAYQQHRDYASEIIKKAMTYTNPEAKKLICQVGASVGITPEEVERFYMGNYLEEGDLKKRPLSKMAKDFYREIVFAKNRPSP